MQSATKILTILTAALTFTACAGNPTYERSDADVEAILTQIDERAYGEPETCISTFQYESVDVLNGQLLMFHDGRRDFWINDLGRPCFLVPAYDAVVLELRGPRVCALDTIRPYDRFMWWNLRGGPGCALGKFHKVSPQQAAGIRDALDS